ncbi:MAG TPA: response regulator [Verrucomicrobiae bacterium]|nr:response regulator [Verrucomicrobiae bacterium]
MPKDANPTKFSICLAIAKPLQASRLETELVTEGFDVLAFHSAKEIWDNFEWRHPRYVITDLNFSDDFPATKLCQAIRARYMLPYVYIHVLGNASRVADIEAALDSGANDYSVKPLSGFQLRARVRVGLRWLQYIDSITMTSAAVRKSNQ